MMSRTLRIAVFAALVLVFLPAVPAGARSQEADDATILHVLNRVAYGPRPGDIARVRAMGIKAYIEQQLAPEKIADPDVDRALSSFETLTMTTAELAEKYYRPLEQARREQQQKAAKDDKAMMAPDPNDPKNLPPEAQALRQNAQSVLQNLMQARMIRAVTSERQLNEVLVDFWFNHFNVYAQKGAVNEYLNEYERDAIRPYVLGNFRDMLGAVAHSPAMLFYLDNFQSVDPNMSARQQDERTRQVQQRLNNPRARMTAEQRERAMTQLEQAKKNAPRGINENYARELMELHTLGVDGGYTQKDVQEMARIFTGWTIDQPRGGGRFVFKPEWHDPNAKTILGETISGHGGVDGMREGERALDILAMHPKTAHHVAFQLAQRFVSDAPPASLVDRAAKVYLKSKGNLREVTRAILTSPEFFSVEAYNAKVKTPLDFVVSAARVTGATIVSAAPLVQALRANLGMPLYGCQPPTGYSTTADAWVNTGALLARMNFGLSLVSNQQQRAIRVNTLALAPDTSQATRDKLVDSILAGRISPTTSATLEKAPNSTQLLALLLGSPEFQKR
ncbi:MAG: DUF1800 domain-containing protein [Acidobacteria bacterium]|nr:MAG: DUF1800 domain-containing protein [Acidobacteriota bacterium]